MAGDSVDTSILWSPSLSRESQQVETLNVNPTPEKTYVSTFKSDAGDCPSFSRQFPYSFQSFKRNIFSPNFIMKGIVYYLQA